MSLFRSRKAIAAEVDPNLRFVNETWHQLPMGARLHILRGVTDWLVRHSEDTAAGVSTAMVPPDDLYKGKPSGRSIGFQMTRNDK